MLEREIVAAIKKYLSSLGSDVFFWKEHGGPYGCAGVPDVICCYKGRFIGLECRGQLWGRRRISPLRPQSYGRSVPRRRAF